MLCTVSAKRATLPLSQTMTICRSEVSAQCRQGEPDSADAFVVAAKFCIGGQRHMLVAVAVQMEDRADPAPHAAAMTVARDQARGHARDGRSHGRGRVTPS